MAKKSDQKSDAARDIDPDRRPLTELQAARLAAMTGLEAKALTGLAVVDIGDKFKWQIDPELLWFRRICGKVVKRDEGTGEEYPVPFATVEVYDTDCSFLGYFPPRARWSWFFPFHCRRELIGTTTTDACGRFCVLVPRWDIDWILRFRRERICFWDIFLRPTIRDLLEELRPEIVRPPRPEPDPPPILKDGGITLRHAEDLLGRHVAGRLARFEAGATVGASRAQQSALLERDAFPTSLPPPLPDEFKRLDRSGPAGAGEASAKLDAVRNTLAARLNISPDQLTKFDLKRFIGPFRRCFDLFFPEWLPIFDVPDITFRVTQDVNGDGTQEVIYSEGYFDVRWNSGPIPDVTLVASPIAVAGRLCDVPDIACTNTPAILFAGRFPLSNPGGPDDPDAYYHPGTGYARRPNRPHPSGTFSDPLPNPLSDAPFGGVLSLFGCNRIPGAVFYRLRYSFNGGALASFLGLTWPLYRVVGGVLQSHWPAADGAGWYPVLPEADNWFPDLLLLDWPTGGFANGHYAVQLEIGNAAKSVIATSPVVGIQIDNRAPTTMFTSFRWKKAGDATWTDIPPPFSCIVIPRGAVPQAVHIELGYFVSGDHFRSVQLGAGGCGGGNPVLSAGTAEHWYTDATDHGLTATATFDVAAGLPPGAYSFALSSVSRAFNPSGGDGGQLADWNYDPPYIHINPSLAVAIVNA